MSFPLPFAPRVVVVGNHLHRGIAAYLTDRRPDLEVRGAAPADLTDDDLAGADAFIGFRRPAQLSSLGTVRWVHSTGAGVDGWLTKDSIDPSILVTRSSERFGGQISEWAIARIFAVQQHLLRLARAQREGRWDQHDVAPVSGTHAVLVGTGDIGRTIAGKLQALGVRCTGVSRTGVCDSPAFDTVHAMRALPSLVASADWLILSLPDTPATRRLIDRDLLSRCQGAVLLNCGRGTVVDEAVIPEALDAGWLRGAALDVFEVEPLPSDSPLWRDPRVLISPHMSGLTTVEGAAGGFLDCLTSLEAGVLPVWAIDRAKGY